MCIRDRFKGTEAALTFAAGYLANISAIPALIGKDGLILACLLYTSDAADERSSVDLGGRRIINKKKKKK